MEISYQLKPAPMELLLCIEAKASKRNAKAVRYQKKRIYIISLIFFVLQIKVFGQPTESKKYLGETPPDLIPKAFASKIISPKDTCVFGSVFSKKADQSWGRPSIWAILSIRKNESFVPLFPETGNTSFSHDPERSFGSG